jgi:uncharacterized protein
MPAPSAGKASRDFQVFAKPAGARCNLDCRYCYYLHKELLYPRIGPATMADDLLEEYIAPQIAITPGPEIAFSWHGGEPTVLGLEYFRRVVELQGKHRASGRRITNSIQTNGVLLTDDWCRFFAAERFAVGLSLDGPPALHDACRVTKDGKTTHGQVMRGYRLLRKHKVLVDLLCVVHARNVRHPLDVYRFFREIGAEYLSFIPLVEPSTDPPDGVGKRSVPPQAFGDFLCSIFDEWFRRDVGKMMVQNFEEAARPALGLDHSLCVFRPTCGDVPVVEHNGDFYSGDHFVTPEHRLGNIRETPLLQLLESPAQRAFGQAKQEALPGYCQQCDVRSMCNGGCPKDRIIRTPDGTPGLNYLCAGYRRFFTHCRPYTVQMASLHAGGHPAAPLVRSPGATAARTIPRAGRNGPCPCGSGLKYKRCCLKA